MNREGDAIQRRRDQAGIRIRLVDPRRVTAKARLTLDDLIVYRELRWSVF